MLAKPISADYLAISKVLADVLPKAKTNILYHQAAPLTKTKITDYYELQLGLPLNGRLTTLFLYKNLDAGYTLTDLGTLLFTNQILEPFIKQQRTKSADAQTYENYDVSVCQFLKQPWFKNFLGQYHLTLTHEVAIEAGFETRPELKTALQAFLNLFNDLLKPDTAKVALS